MCLCETVVEGVITDLTPKSLSGLKVMRKGHGNVVYEQVLRWVLCVSFAVVLGGCVSSSYQPFRLLTTGDLIYPEEAKKAGITGSVTVRYDIQVDGTVTNVSVVSADPPGVFDSDAVSYIRTWVYLPARKNGIVQVTENVESDVTFKLAELMQDPPNY